MYDPLSIVAIVFLGMIPLLAGVLILVNVSLARAAHDDMIALRELIRNLALLFLKDKAGAGKLMTPTTGAAVLGSDDAPPPLTRIHFPDSMRALKTSEEQRAAVRIELEP